MRKELFVIREELLVMLEELFVMWDKLLVMQEELLVMQEELLVTRVIYSYYFLMGCMYTFKIYDSPALFCPAVMTLGYSVKSHLENDLSCG